MGVKRRDKCRGKVNGVLTAQHIGEKTKKQCANNDPYGAREQSRKRAKSDARSVAANTRARAASEPPAPPSAATIPPPASLPPRFPSYAPLPPPSASTLPPLASLPPHFLHPGAPHAHIPAPYYFHPPPIPIVYPFAYPAMLR
jgi:hypothetical protein